MYPDYKGESVTGTVAESGKRKAESGKRKAESGKRKAESGKRKDTKPFVSVLREEKR